MKKCNLQVEVIAYGWAVASVQCSARKYELFVIDQRNKEWVHTKIDEVVGKKTMEKSFKRLKTVLIESLEKHGVIQL